MKRLSTWAMASAVVLMALAGRASAQEPAFGDQGHVAISAERLFGYEHSKRTQTIAGMDTSTTNNSFSLLTNPAGTVSGYGWPRVGVDAFVVRGLSVGGALGFFYLAPEMGSNSTVFLVAPRIGYAATLASGLAIWPRIGITYWNISSDSSTSPSFSAFALTIEAPLAIQLAPRVQLLIGPAVDVGLGGSASQTVGGTTTSTDQKYTDIAGHAGLLVFL